MPTTYDKRDHVRIPDQWDDRWQIDPNRLGHGRCYVLNTPQGEYIARRASGSVYGRKWVALGPNIDGARWCFTLAAARAIIEEFAKDQ